MHGRTVEYRQYTLLIKLAQYFFGREIGTKVITYNFIVNSDIVRMSVNYNIITE